MPDLLNHLDYRTYLKEWFEEQKRDKPFVSYRYIGAKVSMDPGQIVKVFQGEKHLSVAAAVRFGAFAGLFGTEAEYFRHLVLFTKARSPADVRNHFENLQRLRSFRSDALTETQAEFFADWRLPALRALLSFYPWKGWEDLGRQLTPAVTGNDAREAVAKLEELGFLEVVGEMKWNVVTPFLSTGGKWKGAAIRHFQSETMRLAQESLLRHPVEWRDISTLTLSVPRIGIPELKRMVEEFRETILKAVKAMPDPEAVIQLNIQLFPMSNPGGEK